MDYTRTRSRPTVDNSFSFKVGTVTTKSLLTEIIVDGPLMGKPSLAAPDTSYAPLFGTEGLFSAVGVPTFTSSGRVYYDNAALFTRTKSFESQILNSKYYQDLVTTNFLSKLSGTSPLYIHTVGSETMTDTVTPDFKQRSARGEIINKPLTQWKYTARSSIDSITSGLSITTDWVNLGNLAGLPTRCRYKLRVYVNPGTRDYFGVTSSAVDALVNTIGYEYLDPTEAINTAYGNAYQAEADLALFLAEAGKTVSLLAQSGKRIAKIARDIKSGKFLKWAPKAFAAFKAKPASSIATGSNVFLDAWLEARYAWRPLLLDAQAAIKYLSMLSKGSRQTFRGYFGEQDAEEGYTFSTSSGGYEYFFNGTVTRDKGVRAGVLTEIDPGIALSRDLGFQNPLGLAWEVIPYSFVVDWFVNVSGFFAANNPTSGIKILSSWASKTSDISFVGTVTCTNLTSLESKTMEFSMASFRQHRLVDVCPTYINIDISLDVFKLVDSVALLRRFKR